MATPDDIIEARRIANARRMAQAAVTPTPTPTATTSTVDPYYVRDPKTGLSPAQVEANKAIADAAAASGGTLTKGATGPNATADRITFTAEQLKKKREEEYFATQAAAKGTKPTPPPADEQYIYDYVWRQDVGGPGGKWVLVKTPNTGSADWKFDSNGMLFYKGKAFTGTYQGIEYVNGKGPGYKESGGGNPYKPTDSTDTAASDALVAFNKAQAAAETQAKRESAFAILKKEFDKYGLGSLVDSVKNLILTGSSPEEVVLKLRETPEYLKRFAGNKLRLDAGLNVYDEATYLDLENAYDQIFTSYGVEEAVGNTRDARRAKYAEFIGGTKSPDEIKGRVQLAVLASQEDAVTKATMKELYPMITDKDLVSYFLNPKETLPKLETKIRAAQVGAAAVRQGLVTNVATAEELVGLGITEEQAEKGYAAYAGMKPRLDFLSSLEKDQQSIVDQQVAEGALLKNLASEQRKILNLQQKEEGRFGGASGAARGVSLTKQLGGTY